MNTQTKLHNIIHGHSRVGLALCAFWFTGTVPAWGDWDPPGVSIDGAYQDPDTKLVHISGQLGLPYGHSGSLTFAASGDGGETWDVSMNTRPAGQMTLDPPGGPFWIDWDARADWPSHNIPNCVIRVTADNTGGSGLAATPGGKSLSGGIATAVAAVGPAKVNSLQMGQTAVTGDLWTNVCVWALGHGYAFDHAGSTANLNYPARPINWHDAVKWCNARSQFEGRTPVYYTDPQCTAVYKNGQVSPCVNTNANGYRVPAKADWEKTARGSSAGKS